MEMKHALVALLLFGYAFAGLSISSYVVSPDSVEPGGSGYITITLSNPSTQDKVERVSLIVTSAGELGANRNIFVGTLEQGASTIVTIPFQSSSNLSSRVYVIEAKAVGYTDTYTYDPNRDRFIKSSSEYVEKAATIPLKVVKKPILSVSLSSENLEDMTSETIAISNSGGKATNLRLRITSGGLGFLGTDALYFGEVSESSSRSATIDARGASDGPAKLSLLLTYSDELGQETSESKEIPITIKKGEGDFRFSQQAPITTGKDDTLVLVVTNMGDPVSDLQLTFPQLSGVVLRGMNKVEIGSLARGESKTISVPLVASLPPGTNSVQASLSWVEKGENREGTTTVPLSVKSDSEVGVFLEANPTPLASGGQHTLSVTVSNLGSYSIQGVTVWLESEALTLLTVQPEQYIGGLDKDDFSSVQYKVQVGNVAPGNHDATVKVTYRDASGARITETKPVVIRVEAPAQSGDGTGTILLLGAVALAVGYWYFRMRKKPKAVQ